MADSRLWRGESGSRVSDKKFNPALFARLTDGDGFALIHRCRALRREACYACARPIGNAGYVKMARILRGVGPWHGALRDVGDGVIGEGDDRVLRSVGSLRARGI